MNLCKNWGCNLVPLGFWSLIDLIVWQLWNDPILQQNPTNLPGQSSSYLLGWPFHETSISRNEHWKAFRTFSDYFDSNPSSVRGWNIGKIPNNILLKSSVEEKPSPTWTMGRLIDLHGFVPAADQTCSPRRWIHLAKKTTRRHCCEIHPSCAGSGQKTIGGLKLPKSSPDLVGCFHSFRCCCPTSLKVTE